jgi:REP element-mobilizing transposase RayT
MGRNGDTVLGDSLTQAARETPHGKNLRKGRSGAPGLVFAVTKCVADRKPILLEPGIGGLRPADVLVESLRHLHQQGTWDCYGFVVMPDHLHIVVKVLAAPLSRSMESFCKFTGRRMVSVLGTQGAFWQKGFYDHAIRGPKALCAYLDYIRYNPVRAGLIEAPEQWSFSAIYPEWESPSDPM